MTGSEKQIAWAEDIMTAIIPEIDIAIETIRTMDIPAEYEANRAEAIEKAETAKTNSIAKFWIDTFAKAAEWKTRDQGIIDELESKVTLTGPESMNLKIRKDSLANLREEMVTIIAAL